jgi:hypothetical protein
MPVGQGQQARGTCRWCGHPIVRQDGRPDRRGNWHLECVETYKLCWPDHIKPVRPTAVGQGRVPVPELSAFHRKALSWDQHGLL